MGVCVCVLTGSAPWVHRPSKGVEPNDVRQVTECDELVGRAAITRALTERRKEHMFTSG